MCWLRNCSLTHSLTHGLVRPLYLRRCTHTRPVQLTTAATELFHHFAVIERYVTIYVHVSGAVHTVLVHRRSEIVLDVLERAEAAFSSCRCHRQHREDTWQDAHRWVGAEFVGDTQRISGAVWALNRCWLPPQDDVVFSSLNLCHCEIAIHIPLVRSGYMAQLFHSW